MIGTFKELQITTDGSASGAKRVILNSTGIWIHTGSLGGPDKGVLKVDALGYITRGFVSGDNIATGVITTGMLAFSITSGSSGMSGGTSTLSCGPGEVVVGVTAGVADCAPIIGTGDCTGSGYLMGWTSTGSIICSASLSGG